MSDLIDRQAAIDIVRSECRCGEQMGLIEELKALPSAQPEQEKPARWIIYEVANCDGEPPIAWECPECGEVVNCKYKFCPECGKPMEV